MGSRRAPSSKWKAKIGGMDGSDDERLMALQDENAKLKKLVAESMLDNVIMKDDYS
jgi:putative transposase